ncbi:hypothetical protein CcI49_30300 [Frankia sp. CcI49]|uniref:hypothetical protein n=1 Tax=Frankia sp. CcI49 TaxID=1745382 RepID=UPI000977505A|nr:hypothetical protein [Frankia sp. CcI49]ONH54649.1 hypothetical protein CcI49_30300 [Frankia sp. CcI49]
MTRRIPRRACVTGLACVVGLRAGTRLAGLLLGLAPLAVLAAASADGRLATVRRAGWFRWWHLLPSMPTAQEYARKRTSGPLLVDYVVSSILNGA